mgnify:FL=1
MPLRHLSKADIAHLSRANYIPKLFFLDHQFCEHCQNRKQAAVSHPTIALRESSSLDLVHSYVCGPMPHQSLDDASYFVTFIDAWTRNVHGSIQTEPRIVCSTGSWNACGLKMEEC